MHLPRLTLTAVAGLLLMGLGPARADWPEFRGGAAQGVAGQVGLPLTWSEEEHVAWRVPTEGLGWSSPSVAGDRIYLTAAIPRGENVQELTTECRRLENGGSLWRRTIREQVGPVEIHKKNSHASPTPLVAGNRVYVHYGPHATACLHAETGELLWQTQLEYRPQHGTGGSPALIDGKLVICCDGTDVQYIVALDAATGEEVWRTSREMNPSKGFSFSTPLEIQVQGRTQVICPGSEGVMACDPRTGAELWRCRYEGGYSVVPRPLFANGLVYVCSGYNKPRLLAIDPGGSGDVTGTHVRWDVDRGIPHNPTPVIVGQEVYLVSDKGIATCLDALTGEERWQERLGGNYSASPLAADGRIYFQDEDGKCHVIAAAAKFESLATNVWAPGQRTYASFAVAGRSLILRSESELLRVDP